MGSETSPASGAYVGQLADHARKLQGEARDALERGEFTRASALIGDAELLAEDVHGMVGDMERRQLGDLSMLATYDIRALAAAVPVRLPPAAAPQPAPRDRRNPRHQSCADRVLRRGYSAHSTCASSRCASLPKPSDT